MTEHLTEDEGLWSNIWQKMKVYDQTVNTNNRSLTEHLPEEDGLWLNIYQKKVYDQHPPGNEPWRWVTVPFTKPPHPTGGG